MAQVVEPHGLTSEAAAQRRIRFGPNRLPQPRPPSAWRRLIAQMVHFFALMLWTAALLAFVAGLTELAIAICLVVVINGVFAFAQEARAEHAAQRLQDLLPQRCVVRRDGIDREIEASDLVIDDLVVLTAGDRISADMTTVRTHGLTVDTSMLTGESVPVAIDTGATLFAGTFVVEGEGRALVTATGASTRLGSIAQLTRREIRPRGTLAHELDHVVRIIAMVAVGCGIGFFGVAMLVGTRATDGFLFAIGVTVALVPEGLLPTVTLSLAIGAQRMSDRSALVRRLEAVETLGSTTFICTDKTGTLTRNEMSVVEVWTPAGSVQIRGEGYAPTATISGAPDAVHSVTNLAAVGARCSSGYAHEQDGRW
ncbi:MAG: cation-transporting P-type ATPase, partial [Acidimicrobiia bacterium]|nr:cation-transporting P-type ATPase [Acidimicrobiia bacterium]